MCHKCPRHSSKLLDSFGANFMDTGMLATYTLVWFRSSYHAFHTPVPSRDPIPHQVTPIDLTVLDGFSPDFVYLSDTSALVIQYSHFVQVFWTKMHLLFSAYSHCSHCLHPRLRSCVSNMKAFNSQYLLWLCSYAKYSQVAPFPYIMTPPLL